MSVQVSDTRMLADVEAMRCETDDLRIVRMG
jgi:hypothetical protein